MPAPIPSREQTIESLPHDIRQQLYGIAQAHKALSVVFLFMAVALAFAFLPALFPDAVPTDVGGVAFMILVVLIVPAFLYCYRLTVLLEMGGVVLMLLGMLVPCINLVLLLLVLHFATQTLKKYSISLGFLGARQSHVNALKKSLS